MLTTGSRGRRRTWLTFALFAASLAAAQAASGDEPNASSSSSPAAGGAPAAADESDAGLQRIYYDSVNEATRAEDAPASVSSDPAVIAFRALSRLPDDEQGRIGLSSIAAPAPRSALLPLDAAAVGGEDAAAIAAGAAAGDAARPAEGGGDGEEEFVDPAWRDAVLAIWEGRQAELKEAMDAMARPDETLSLLIAQLATREPVAAGDALAQLEVCA